MADWISHEAPAHKATELPVAQPVKLVGREATLAQIYSQLKLNKAVLLHGAAGIGKTAIAATLASAYTELPGGTLWLDSRLTPFAELLVNVGRAYGIAEITGEQNPVSRVGIAVATLTQNKPLIVIDGEIDSSAASEFIMRVADRVPVLMTHDGDALTGPWMTVELPPLAPDPATAMLRTLAPGIETGAGDLVARLEYQPFAISVAAGAARLRRQTPAELLVEIRPGVPPHTAALTLAFTGLNSALQGVLLLLSATFRGEVSEELLAQVANAPTATIQQVMTALVGGGLVERITRYGKTYYKLHPLTFAFARDFLRRSNKLDDLQNRFRDAVIAYARQHGSDPEALATEMDTFVSTARWAAEKGDRETPNAIAVALAQARNFVQTHGYVNELLELQELSVSSSDAFPAYMAIPEPRSQQPALFPAADEADEADDDSLLAPGIITEEADEDEGDSEDEDLFDDTGTLDYDFDELSEDDEDEGEDEFDEDEDDEGDEVQAFNMPVAAFGEIGAEDELDIDEDFEDEDEFDDDLEEDEDEDFDEPLPMLEDEDDDLEDSAPSQPSTPIVYPDEISRLRAELVEARTAGDRRRQAELLAAIGRELERGGSETEAIASYDEALNAYEEVNDQAGMLQMYEALATLIVKTDNVQAAVLNATRGASLARQMGSESAEQRLMTLLGDARQQLGESDEAIVAYSEALDLARAASDSQAEADVLYKLGYAQLDSGDAEEALSTWEDALTTFRTQGNRKFEGRVLSGMGTASGELGRWSEAVRFYNSALYVAREVADRADELLQLSNLGYASIQERKLGEAVLYYRQALHLAFLSEVAESIVSTTVDLARLLIESKRHHDITEMLIDTALRYDPTDRDLLRLKERITTERQTTTTPQAPVNGTAQQYAANAYTG